METKIVFQKIKFLEGWREESLNIVVAVLSFFFSNVTSF